MGVSSSAALFPDRVARAVVGGEAGANLGALGVSGATSTSPWGASGTSASFSSTGPSSISVSASSSSSAPSSSVASGGKRSLGLIDERVRRLLTAELSSAGAPSSSWPPEVASSSSSNFLKLFFPRLHRTIRFDSEWEPTGGGSKLTTHRLGRTFGGL